MKSSIIALTAAVSLFGLTPAHADDMTGVDPGCIITNADNTQTVDKTKCPDGKTMMSTDPAASQSSTDTTQSEPSTTGQDASQPATTTTESEPSTSTDMNDTASTAPMDTPVIVPSETLKGAKVMSANTYIGKRVYDTEGNDIGEVNDLIITTDGKIQAVILGVGGFLGLGEKDVAVSVSSVKVETDGSSAKLVVNATKDELTAAPTYDKSIQNYAS